MSYEHITSEKLLANFLRCDVSFLNRLIQKDYYLFDPRKPIDPKEADDVEIEKLYLKKKGRNGGFREVFAARDFQLSNTLKILNNSLTKSFNPEAYVHGFVPGRSIKTNADNHLAKKRILSVDIKTFFDSITIDQVKTVLVEHSFNEQVAQWLSQIITFENHLVQGFHSSPTLANMVFNAVDKQLNELCGGDVTYTRYADDLYFSTNSELPELKKIEEIITNGGFELNEQKTSFMERGRRQYVTGLTVFDNNLPRVSRNVKRNLRLEIYYINKFGFRNHAIKRLTKSDINFDKKDETKIQIEISEIHHRVHGWIDFINSIEPVRAHKLHAKLITTKP